LVQIIKKHGLDEVEVLVSFYEEREKRGLFARSKKKIVWERWGFAFHIQEHTVEMSEQTGKKLKSMVEQILSVCDANKEHLPSIKTIPKGRACFPFNVHFPGLETSIFDFSFLKRVVRDTASL